MSPSKELDAWLGAFLSEGPAVLAEAFDLLDYELQVLLLAHLIEVYDVRTDNIPDRPDDMPRRSTPDGFFVIFSRDVGNREVEPFALVAALYDYDMQTATRLVTAAKWELTTTLEEEAFRFREGRLQDLGFIPPDEAAALFAAPPQEPPDGALLKAPSTRNICRRCTPTPCKLTACWPRPWAGSRIRPCSTDSKASFCTW